nr:AMF-inducible phosphate transporter Pht1;6 [Pteris vittata]
MADEKQQQQPAQLEVLTALDKAKTQWYHFTAIVIAGMGFFTDAYDLFCISTVTKLLGRLYYYDPSTGKPGVLPPTVYGGVTGVALCGTLVGQLFFGWLGDKFGRKKVYGMTLMIMVFSSIASGLSFGHTAKSVMVSICFFRFWLGFGIGGDYPLSATIMSEYANKRTRGAFIAAVFAMQGFGILGGAIVSIIVSAAFNNTYPRPPFKEDHILSTPPQADFVWRIIFMLGAIPAAFTYYWRMKMPETARYTALVAGNAKQAAADMSKVLDVQLEAEHEKVRRIVSEDNYDLFSMEFARRHGKHLIGTTTTWFLLDVAFYSQNLFQKDVFTAIGWLPKGAEMSALEEVFLISKAQALLAMGSTVPGYWCTVGLIDYLGRYVIQLMGFACMTVFMFAVAIPYYKLRGEPCATGFCNGHKELFLTLYAFTFFFANFGPNSTTFIVPAEVFPARLRSTCHGISAAFGKLGAIIGAFGFLYASQDSHEGKQDAGYSTGIGVQNALIMLAVVNALGLFCTYFFVPETKGQSLEDLSGENEQIANGGTMSMSRSQTKRETVI